MARRGAVIFAGSMFIASPVQTRMMALRDTATRVLHRSSIRKDSTDLHYPPPKRFEFTSGGIMGTTSNFRTRVASDFTTVFIPNREQEALYDTDCYTLPYRFY